VFPLVALSARCSLSSSFVCFPLCFFFLFNDTSTTEIYTLSYTTLFRSLSYRHPFYRVSDLFYGLHQVIPLYRPSAYYLVGVLYRSEEHTSELQSRFELVCRLLLEKKKTSNKSK